MTLSSFILNNLEPILVEWESFAATLAPEVVRMDPAALRDHGQKMLEAIAKDLSEPESTRQKADKSKGDGPRQRHETAATAHGFDRLASGFSLNAAVAEYRALRASVIRLWQTEIERTYTDKQTFEDLIRFNEAIDQAISESVTSYSAEKEKQTLIFNTILSNTPDFSFTFDPSGNLTFANRALLEFLHLLVEEAYGKPWTSLNNIAGAELQRNIELVIDRRETLRSETELKDRNGNALIFDSIFVPVTADNESLESVVGMMRDITTRKSDEKKNWRMANFDELTGLTNRSLFLDRLERAVLNSGRSGLVTALLFIDLDHFKQVNDSFGHAVGDALLKGIADRIVACVRATDTVARLGGDEFTVILHEVDDAEHIHTVAEKLIAALATQFQINEHTVQVSASIGISIFSQEAQTTHSLMFNADLAMYAAKRAGRDRVVFFSPNLLELPRRESIFGRL